MKTLRNKRTRSDAACFSVRTSACALQRTLTARCAHCMPSALLHTLTASHHPKCAPPTYGYASHKHLGRDTRMPFMLAKMNGSRSSQYMIPDKPCGGCMAPQSRGCSRATCWRRTVTSSTALPTGWRRTVSAFHARTYASSHSPSWWYQTRAPLARSGEEG